MLSPIEKIKTSSDGLRGTLKESLADQHTGAIRPDDEALIKFHGMYQQDDREKREERAEKKLENLFSFMIRLRIPGGVITAKQWEAIDELSWQYGTGVLKITTRQTVQLHGLFKQQLRPLIQGLLVAELDSIAACGDVNRNVVGSSHPQISDLHTEIHSYADKISTLLLPKTEAYYEIWINEEKVYERGDETDPLYEDRYLPRKFKIAVAIPPSNDVDVFANDIGLIAIVEDGKFVGFNLAVGGGLSTTHGNPDTYPRTATIIGFTEAGEQTLKAVYEVLTVQRDFGNRADRKQARLKYTVDKMGVEGFKKELESRIGFKLAPARDYVFTERNDRFGWQQDKSGNWFYTLFVEHGVVKPYQKELLAKIARKRLADYRFTCNQNLILGNISPENKDLVKYLLEEAGVEEKDSALRRSSMACTALPTCPLALAEGQRYLPELVSKIEPIAEKHGMGQDEIIIRMTGCPNGCARPYLAELAFVGTGPGLYNFMLGGDRLGTRLNKIYKKSVGEAEILNDIDVLFGRYKVEKTESETFGDFANRAL